MRLFHAAVPRILAIGLVLSLGVRSATAAEGWLVSLEKAKEQAAKEGKDILMEFTGSDWCPPCIALNKNVLSTEEFQTEVPKQFVLLKLDSPRDKSQQSEEEQAQYRELSKKFNVTGVPTVLLADASGRPYAKKVGYGGTPAEEYIGELKQTAKTREQRDELLAKAEAASGVEKAKLLDEALDVVGDLALVAYPDVANQIVELDAENQAGLKEKYEGKLRSQQIEEALTGIRREYATVGIEGTLARIDQLITELNPQGETLQQVLFLKAQLLYGTDKAKSKSTLEAAQKLAPESRIGRQIDAVLKQAFKDEPQQESDEDSDSDE